MTHTRYAFVKARWHADIVDRAYDGFSETIPASQIDVVDVPVIASGGMGNLGDLEAVVLNSGADAVAMAHVLHYQIYSIDILRDHCIKAGIPVRRI